MSDEPANFSFHRSLRVVAEPDVLVVGAGCAGTTAAIAAARSGASTLVVERAGYCGGYITNVVGPSLDGFVDLRSGLPIVGGVVLDLVRAAAFADVPARRSGAGGQDAVPIQHRACPQSCGRRPARHPVRPRALQAGGRPAAHGGRRARAVSHHGGRRGAGRAARHRRGDRQQGRVAGGAARARSWTPPATPTWWPSRGRRSI